MKIGDDTLIKIGQLNTLNRNQKLQPQGAVTSQFGSLFASVLNQLLLETETQASDQSSLTSYAPNMGLGSLFGNNVGLDSLFATIGLNTDGLDSILGSIADGSNASDPSSGNTPLNTATSKLVNDLPINNNQPLRFRSISPEKLNQVLDGKLQGMGQVFIQAGKLYNVDPALLAAISQHETGNGKSHAANEKNNIAGMMGANGLKSYSSVEASIMDMARNLSKNYLGEGLTSISKIGAKYAPIGADNDPTGLNNDWVKGVTHYYHQLRV
jgi:hypothetical protein